MTTSFKNADLRGANFSGVDLEGVDFEGALIRDVNFEGAKLVNADLSKADFQTVTPAKVVVIPRTESTHTESYSVMQRQHPDKPDKFIENNLVPFLCIGILGIYVLARMGRSRGSRDYRTYAEGPPDCSCHKCTTERERKTQGRPPVKKTHKPDSNYLQCVHLIDGIMLPAPDSDGWKSLGPKTVSLDSLSITKLSLTYELKVNGKSVETRGRIDEALHLYCDATYQHPRMRIESDRYQLALSKVARETDRQLGIG